MTNEIVQGDNGTILTLTISDDKGVIDLTGASVQVNIQYRKVGVTKTAVITDAINGKCEVTLNSEDLQYQGIFPLQTTVTFQDGKSFSSDIQYVNIKKKLDFAPSIGGSSGSIGSSGTNGSITVNGVEIKVYDDTSIKSRLNADELDIATLKSFLPLLNRLGIDSNNNLTVDGKIVGSTVTPTQTDTTPPNNVTGLSISNISSSGLSLTWIASTSSDVASYDVYQGSTLLGNTTNTTYSVTGLSASTSYSFTVKAKDSSGNVASGTSVNATTLAPPDTTSPVVSISPSAGTFGSVQTVTLSGIDNSGGAVSIYYTLDGSTPTTSSAIYSSPITVSTTTTIKYFGKDPSGNVSTVQSALFTIDTVAPNNVTNLATSNVSTASLTLSWTASTSTDIASYDIYNGSTLLGNVTGTTYNISGLTANTAYTFTVKAKDTVGNVASGTSVSATTVSPVPNDVTGLTTSNVTSASLTLNWTASTYATSYDVYNGATLLGNTTSTAYNVSGLSASTSYTFKVIAKNSTGSSVGVTTNATTSAPPQSAPSDVTGLAVSNLASTSLTLSWTASSTATSYDIYENGALLTNVTGVTYGVTGLTANTSYTFKVIAKNSVGSAAGTSAGASVSTTTLVSPPADVTGLTTSNVTATSLTLSWTGSTGATSYDVYKGSTLLTNVTGTSYGVIGLTGEIVYTFKVVAKNTGGSSTGVTVNVTTLPADVTNLTTGTATVNSIPVSWTLSSSSNIANYEVAYSTTGSAPWTVASNLINSSSTSYTINGLTAGTNYTIRVVTIDTSGNRSNGVTVTKSTAASVNYSLSATPSSGTYNATQNVVLSASPSGATIYYTTDGSTPTTSSSIYSSPIAVSANGTETIKFFAQDSVGNVTSAQTATYTIDTIAPTVTISPVAGTYNSTQSVTISANETSTIYYTIDGSTPTTSSTAYSSPISVSSTETIKYLVIDTAGNQTTGSAAYSIIPIIAVKGVSLNYSSLTLGEGKTSQLTATITPANATNQNVTWSVSDATIATVDNTGLVTGIAVGNVTVTVTTQDGNYTASCSVSVNLNGFDYNNLVAYPSDTTDTFDQTVTFSGAGGFDWVHPSVLHFPSKWNGHEWWMGINPYPSTQGAYENPFLFYSDDGDSWHTLPGEPTPIEPLNSPKPPIAGTTYTNNSDVHIFMDADGVTMHLLNRAVYNGTPGQNGVPAVTNSGAAAADIQWVSSTDGVTWTTPQILFGTAQTGYDCLAPSVIYWNNNYYIFGIDGGDQGHIYVYKSPTISAGTWTVVNKISTGTLGNLWHPEVRYINGEFIVIANTGGAQGGNLMLGKFTNPETDTVITGRNNAFIIPPADQSWNLAIYKSSLVYVNDNDIQVYVGFKGSALNANTGWRVVRVQAQRLPQTLDLSGYTQVNTYADNSSFNQGAAPSTYKLNRMDYFKYAVDFTITDLTGKFIAFAYNSTQWGGFYISGGILKFELWQPSQNTTPKGTTTDLNISYGISVNDRCTLIQDDNKISFYINGRLVGSYDNTTLPLDDFGTLFGDLNNKISMSNITTYKLPQNFYSATVADNYKANTISDYQSNPSNYWWYDEFNHANGTVTGNSDNGITYQIVGSPSISGNVLAPGSFASNALIVPGHLNMQVLLKSLKGAYGFSFYVKYTDQNNNLRLQINDTDFVWVTRLNGVDTRTYITTSAASLSNYQNLRFDIQDAVMNFYADGLFVGKTSVPQVSFDTKIGLASSSNYTGSQIDYIIVKKLTTSDTTPASVTASPVGGTFSDSQSITLTSSETGAAMYYTTDASTPIAGQGTTKRYSTPILLTNNTTLQYYSIDLYGNKSGVQSQTYTITDTTAPQPIGSLTVGTATSTTIPLTWTKSSSVDVQYYEVAYSTDGTNFTVASGTVANTATSYTVSGLTASTSYTIRVVAIDYAGNRSTTVTKTGSTTA